MLLLLYRPLLLPLLLQLGLLLVLQQPHCRALRLAVLLLVIRVGWAVA
jgi:hypothetical protein